MKKLALVALLSALPSFAAANLAMSSATLAADGVTFTIPFTGTCQTPLSPASGILGFTITVPTSGWGGSVSAATRSGCTVTLVSSEPISVDETPTITLASTTGVNFLTDNSGNTPTGQAGFAVTKNTEWHGANGASMAGKFQDEGAGGSAGSYTFQLNGLLSDWCYRFNATATQLDVFAYNNHNIWQIRQDGAPIHTYAENDTNTFTEQGLVTGLSGAHEYEVCQNNPQGQNFYYSSLIRIRITGTIGAQPTIKPIIAAGGDSIAFYGGPEAPTDSTLGDQYQMASALGLATTHWASDGDQLCASMDTQIPTGLNYLTGSFPFLTVAGSTDYNDHSSGTSAAMVGACMNTLLTNIEAMTDPPTHILVFGNLPFTAPIDPSFDVAIAAALAGHPTACFAERLDWIDTVAWTGSTGDRQSDQVHVHASSKTPPLFGYAKLANRENPIAQGWINGSSFNISGSSTGTVGLSTNLSTVPTGGWLWDGNETLTITSSVSTDTVCIGASCGTHTITATPGAGTTPTVSIRPATVGSRTLTSSGLANCWTAPSPFTLTAGAGTVPTLAPIL